MRRGVDERLLVVAGSLIELTYLDGKHIMPEHVNAMTLPHITRRVFEVRFHT